MELIKKYFPNLTELQYAQLEALGPQYRDWNSKINVISRKDIDHLYERHILHALTLKNIISFKEGADVLDLGTGGGIPGIPLAILFPETNFTLLDGRGKKITVVNEIAGALDLKNVTGIHGRAEELKNKKFDFVVARGVASLDKLLGWTRRLLKEKQAHGTPNGLLAYKGGDIKAEIGRIPNHEYVETYPFTEYYEEPFFEEKYLLYVQG
jgi:16S rRNA (guanine527-N7)-methyltransferase